MKVLILIALILMCALIFSCSRAKENCVHLHAMSPTGPEIWTLCGPAVRCTEEADASGRLTKCHVHMPEGQQ